MGTTKKEEFTRVQRVSDNKYNLIDANGKLLSEQWFYWVDYFHDGFAMVKRGEFEYNYIDTKGKILSDEWFRRAYNFKDGFAVVQRSDYKYNFIDKNGNYLLKEWVYSVEDFHWRTVQKLTKTER